MADTPQTPNPEQEEQQQGAFKIEKKENRRKWGAALAENLLDAEDMLEPNPFGKRFDMPPAEPAVQNAPEEGVDYQDYMAQDALLEQADADRDESQKEYDENKKRIASLGAKSEHEPKLSGGVLYDAIAGFGTEIYRCACNVLRGFLKPMLLLEPLLRLLCLVADYCLFKSVRAIAWEWRVFRLKMKNIKKQQGKYSFMKEAAQVIRGQKRFFARAMNVLMPAAALALFVLTVNYWGGMTFALQVNYNNKNIGYIADESVYTQAKEMALERIVIGSTAESTAAEKKQNTSESADAGEAQDRAESAAVEEKQGEAQAASEDEKQNDAKKEAMENLNKAGYELKLITLNQLNDAPTICDRLIENSDQNLTNACGIYVDNEFICAVKNRADAENVFNSILEPYQNKKENSFAAFVEKVEYRPGLYSGDAKTMWDASQLAQRVKTPKSGQKTYVAVEGDTDYGIARAHDLTDREFDALNPGRGKYVHEGDKYVVANEVSFVQIKIMRTENRMAELVYITETSNNSSMFQGDRRTVREGTPGQERVTELVTYVDGQRISASEISRTVVTEPIAAKVQVGTKSTKVTGYGGSTYHYSNKGFIWPAPRCTVISSPYGQRRMGNHKGVDLILPGGGSTGAVIVAAKSGVVEEAHWAGSYGNCVVINHGDGYKTRYAHMQPGSMSVSVGQKVSAGQSIGRVGRTGNTTGPHLHFEVVYRGQQQNPMNYIRR